MNARIPQSRAPSLSLHVVMATSLDDTISIYRDFLSTIS
jgi:hypothetical protein